jgi:uncharacterized membrane protein
MTPRQQQIAQAVLIAINCAVFFAIGRFFWSLYH